jgi:putative ABC transport system substrate-binding protein
MKRREFVALIGGAAAAWPLPARSEQPDKVPRVGALMGFAETDPIGLRRFAAFKKGLEDAGWTEGRNLTIDVRWTADDPEKDRPIPPRHPDDMPLDRKIGSICRGC